MPFAIPFTWKLIAIGALIIAWGGSLAWAHHSGAVSGKAEVIAADQKAIEKAQKKADDIANELIIAQAQAMAVTEKTVTVYRDRVIHAPTTTTCGPAVRDAAAGVLDAFRGSDPKGRPAHP